MSDIVVLGAREHNLKGVDLTIPRDSLVVFTGLSGSGKSSLAFDTIYQEGQRRFLESLSAYARQFLGKMEKPKVDHVEGLSPTISIDQKTVNRNPRSTVGTVTEITDHLRLLMARLGVPHCPECDTPITAMSPGQIADALIAIGGDLLLMAPIIQERKGEYRKELEDLRKAGWVRARVDGVVRKLDEEITLARYEKHTIEVVIDRVKALVENRARILEGVEKALEMSGGTLTTEGGTWSSQRACPRHPSIAIPELEPRLFSFNAPQGACPECKGLGELVGFDPALMVDPELPAAQAPLVFGSDGRLPFSTLDRQVLEQLLRHLGANPKRPWRELSEAAQKAVMAGEGVEWTYRTTVDRDGRREVREGRWQGLTNVVAHLWHYTHHSPWERFRSHRACSTCKGSRHNPISLAVRFRGKNIADFTAMSVEDATAFFGGLRLQGSEAEIGREILREIQERLSFLHAVGLGYLSLNRSAATLSGGEAQRIRLAAQVGSGLQGVTYVLDEPSIGLHARDNRRLLDTLLHLRDLGNSVLVVEHDRETMEAADDVVDVGPGAGREGGRVVAHGPPRSLRSGPTADWLRGRELMPTPPRRAPGATCLRIVGARANNLRGITVEIPLGVLTVVTGVSGSGKSSLIVQTLVPALVGGEKRPGPFDRLEGRDQIDKVVVIDQSPIGRTPRSNPATYTGAFDHIRKLFAELPEARARGYKPGRFSFNVAGGRCEACEGAGVQVIEMQFLADVEIPCEVCGGRRFNAETLEVLYKGRSITDVLEMPIGEAAEFFKHHKALHRILSTLAEVGMGYVTLGQASTTLSGGEAQRIKLATELHRPDTGRTLYILDEPTTGLHFQDVRRLVASLDRLVDHGNTVLVIEHNTDVILHADHIIDIGPEGGSKGGQLVGVGTPEHIATLDTPTGRVLRAGSAPFKPRKHPLKHESGDLVITGARMHNLKGVDVRIPRNRLTVITGVSGSGKSSLAFDTIFAEGQRRYVECMSTYARRFLGRLDRAPVDKVEGLAPAIAIDQKTASHNPRSTVATVTEIYDYLRLVWARLGQPHCPHCARPLRAVAPSAAWRHLRGKGWILADCPLGKELVAEGFARAWHQGKEIPLEVATEGMLVIDRIDADTAERHRIAEAVTTAYARGRGRALFQPRDGSPPVVLLEAPLCPDHGKVLPDEITPRHFSFNSWVGACSTCDGTGRAMAVDPELLLADRSLGFWEALDKRVASVLKRGDRSGALVEAALAHVAVGDTPIATWSAEKLDFILRGEARLMARWTQVWGKTRRNLSEELEWKGILALVEGWSSPLEWLRRERTCPACGGGRLRPEILAITLGERSISAACGMTVAAARTFFDGLSLDERDSAIAEQPLREIRARLRFLGDVGLAYLALDRSAATLSGGESQRIRLASQLGSGLVGCLYVLDEPTVGLHPRDTERLLGTLGGLRDLGNTVVVVEHDPDTIRRADHVVDMGPAAGDQGGEVMAAGSPAEIEANPASLTGAYLSGRRPMPRPSARRAPTGHLRLRGATANNLRDLDVDFPTGCLVAVTGVSGSGKSSLVMDCLVPALQGQPGPYRALEGAGRLVVVDQSPIGISPRSTPATACKILDPIRELFAATNVARERGWEPGRFSFNAEGGRCAVCEGRGCILVEMHFLSDVWITCEACRGRRFDPATLDARWQGLSIADVLDLRCSEALEAFANHRSIRRPLQSLVDVGLGYLRLGQPSTTLSGGEAQRVKLAKELHSRQGDTIFVLDEPTTGLHFADVEKLIGVLQRLVDAGGTVIVIEHNTDLILNADHVIDLGPEGGNGGGRLLAEGPPDAIRAAGTDTGRWL